MVGPNAFRLKPEGDCIPNIYRLYSRELPAILPPEVQRSSDRDSPTPMPTPTLKFLTLRRSRLHRIGRGLLHVHQNGLRTREPTCPKNATCVGIDDIGEYMYNYARKRKNFLNELSRLKDPNRQSVTDNKPLGEVIGDEPCEINVNLMMKLCPPIGDVQQENCWDEPAISGDP